MVQARIKMLHPLRFRLLVMLILVVIATVGGIALVSTQVTTRTFQGYEDRRGTMRDQRFQGFLTMYYARHGDWSGAQLEVERIEQITGERVILANGGGRIVADSEGELIGQLVGQGWGTPAAWLVHNGVSVGALYVGLPGGNLGIEGLLTSTNRTLLLVALAAGLGAVLLILSLSHRILAPVEALTVAVRQMEAGDLSQQVEIASNDEIGDLARAFNSMADGLARLEELRRNMVSDVAHELRTPLTNIQGYLQALRDGVLEPERHVIDSLYAEAILLNHLVDDLQELSLAEAGQLRLERQPVALADVVDRAVGPFGSRAETEGITLQVNLPEDLPLVDVDPQRIGQVLRNLVENGLTYTESGGNIGIAACVRDLWIEVKVWDTGTGIAAEDLPFVFERFYRADKSRSRATGGAGLGLAIAKQLIEAHGGRIEVESRIGQGTQFTFKLPVAKS
jgi:signal transduction histidine kinase